MCFSPFPSFLRSSPMKLYSLRLPRETAFTVINHLGELSLLHFMDSSPESPMFSRYYSKSIKRCEECLLKLEDLTQIMHKFKKSPKKLDDIPKFLIEFRGMIKSRNKPETSYLDEVENEINEKYEQLQEQLKIYEDIAKNKSILLEEKVSMIRAKTFIRSHQTLGVFQEEEISLEEGVHFHENKNIQMHYYMGLLMNEDMIRFKRMIFRSSKGNALLFTEDLLPAENPIDAKTVRKFYYFWFLM